MPLGAFIPLCTPVPIDPMSPGAKQETLPLGATLNCEGQVPLLTSPDPWACTVNSFPSALPATPTVMPGISYAT